MPSLQITLLGAKSEDWEVLERLSRTQRQRETREESLSRLQCLDLVSLGVKATLQEPQALPGKIIENKSG